MTGLLGKLYRELWGRVGGRLWTEIVRDEQKLPPQAYRQILAADIDWVFAGNTLRAFLVVIWKTEL